MRTTQYIGLTKDAMEYVKSALGSESVKIDDGMFGEPVIGQRYFMPAPDGPNRALEAKEVVQGTVFSSGPMIFTCLELTLIKKSGQRVDLGKAFQWVLNPMVDCEFDYEKGHYYI